MKPKIMPPCDCGNAAVKVACGYGICQTCLDIDAKTKYESFFRCGVPIENYKCPECNLIGKHNCPDHGKEAK